MLIIEDGTGVANANSYVDLAQVTAYARLIGNTAWDDSASRQTAAVLAATRFIDARCVN